MGVDYHTNDTLQARSQGGGAGWGVGAVGRPPPPPALKGHFSANYSRG